MSYVTGFLTLVVQIVFGLLIFLVLARFILQLVRADFYNPVSQMFLKVTDPMLRRLRRVVPGLFGIDMAAIVLLLILQALELMITHLLRGMGLHGPLLFTIETIGNLIAHAAQLYIICIFIIIILSWVNPAAGHHPVVRVAGQIVAPVMRPARRILPPVGGFDFSPILALILVFAVLFLVAAPLMDLPHKRF